MTDLDLARLKQLADGATPGVLEARYAPGIPTAGPRVRP